MVALEIDLDCDRGCCHFARGLLDWQCLALPSGERVEPCDDVETVALEFRVGRARPRRVLKHMTGAFSFARHNSRSLTQRNRLCDAGHAAWARAGWWRERRPDTAADCAGPTDRDRCRAPANKTCTKKKRRQWRRSSEGGAERMGDARRATLQADNAV